ncbi:serine protease grass-like [Topomyia yanbarensis]|uniref:serine protease grass-like n=1 Tax=Topomyia yanbarensis TaxID=2498891 RepID=UPI00273CD865|nr:serine protease grass-like [Topomyia yanbarensis]
MKRIILVLIGLGHYASVGICAQSAPCTTPTGHPGLCVPLEHCRNIYSIIQSKQRPSQGILNYIRRSVCRLPEVRKAVCCQLTEVDQTIASLAPDKPLLPTNCGTTTADRVAYGKETGVFECPWMALLRFRDFNQELVDGCGGSLIHERYVLTAAHCLHDRKLILDHVRLGEHNKVTDIDCEGVDGDCAGPVQDIRVETTITHPMYNNPKFRNDIGLVRLASNARLDDQIKPICLPVTKEYSNMLHSKYILTGWGTTENNSLSNVLLKAYLPRVDNEQCEHIMRNNSLTIALGEQQLCAGGSDRKDSCRGDSGGPLGTVGLLYNEPRFIQFGIVSIGVNTCGLKNIPSIYTRVGLYMDWILENIKPS